MLVGWWRSDLQHAVNESCNVRKGRRAQSGGVRKARGKGAAGSKWQPAKCPVSSGWPPLLRSSECKYARSCLRLRFGGGSAMHCLYVVARIAVWRHLTCSRVSLLPLAPLCTPVRCCFLGPADHRGR